MYLTSTMNSTHKSTSPSKLPLFAAPSFVIAPQRVHITDLAILYITLGGNVCADRAPGDCLG